VGKQQDRSNVLDVVSMATGLGAGGVH